MDSVVLDELPVAQKLESLCQRQKNLHFHFLQYVTLTASPIKAKIKIRENESEQVWFYLIIACPSPIS